MGKRAEESKGSEKIIHSVVFNFQSVTVPYVMIHFLQTVLTFLGILSGDSLGSVFHSVFLNDVTRSCLEVHCNSNFIDKRGQVVCLILCLAMPTFIHYLYECNFDRVTFYVTK